MILPSKYIRPEKALLSIGGELLKCLDQPKTVSAVWETVRHGKRISYDWFILSLDLLYAIGAVDYQKGLLRRSSGK